jgi:hypothetical protein
VTGVIIGIDPHKGAHTAVALDRDEKTLARLRVKANTSQTEQLRRFPHPCQSRLTSHAVSVETDSMSEATQLAAAAAHDDPEIGLAAVVALRQLLDQLEALQVASARDHGWTWERIAAALGVTRQSVHKKYATRRLPGRRAR